MACGIRITLRFLVISFLVMTIVPCARAQSSDSSDAAMCEGTSGPERIRCLNGMKGSRMIFFLDGPQAAQQNCGVQLLLEWLRADLRELSVANDYLASVAQQPNALDLQAVAKATEKIQKLTVRVRDLLALPDLEPSGELKHDEMLTERARLRSAIFELTSLLTTALENPVLRGKVLDLKQAAQASADLESIIVASMRIRMSCRLILTNDH